LPPQVHLPLSDYNQRNPVRVQFQILSLPLPPLRHHLISIRNSMADSNQ
jgi:hypothetical protein